MSDEIRTDRDGGLLTIELNRPDALNAWTPELGQRLLGAVCEGADDPAVRAMLITGAGPIGIMCIPVVRHAGARHIVITDPNPYRLELARKMGATLAVNPMETPIAEVQKQLGLLEGFDVGLEMSGNANALREMLSNMSHGGKIAILGIPAGEMSIDLRQVVFKMLTIKGIYGREMYETWYKMGVLIESGVDITPIITHRYSYADFEQGFHAMMSGNTGKVILDWTTLQS